MVREKFSEKKFLVKMCPPFFRKIRSGMSFEFLGFWSVPFANFVANSKNDVTSSGLNFLISCFPQINFVLPTKSSDLIFCFPRSSLNFFVKRDSKFWAVAACVENTLTFPLKISSG